MEKFLDRITIPIMIITILLVILLAWILPTHAATIFEWDRNSETDMDHYELYTCATSASCIPGTGPTDRLGSDILQPALGVKPTMPIPVGTEGRAAVLAVDLSGNKSGLSNIVPFDRKPPASATGFMTK